MTDFKTIPLSEIHPDKNQPRQIIDAVALAELTESVREKGVLQPILLRPNGKGYLIVCGERRFHASKAAGKADIPAVIRTLSDDEALELQIIENLQRKDVHPMEEAVAFKSLTERKKGPLSVEEIALRIGKNAMFVRQRLKLNALSKLWQSAFYKDIISLRDAINIAILPEAQQKELGEEYDLGTDRIQQGRKIEINSYTFNKFLGKLNNATFDLTDPTLSPKFGACTTCPFNSAVASLFPDDAKNPVCTNIPDFVLKTNVAFERKIKEAKEDPSMVLITEYGHLDAKVKLAYEKEGHKVYSGHDYDSAWEPNKPDWEDFKEENEDEDWSDEKMQKEFDKEQAEYENKMVEFRKKIEGGKFLKGLVISGRDPGEIKYIKLRSKTAGSSSKATAEKQKEGKLTAADIDGEIKRINDREKRSKELDMEKVWSQVSGLAGDHKKFASVPFDSVKTTQEELDAMAFALVQKINKSGFNKAAFKIIGSPNTTWADLGAAKRIKNITESQIFHLLRLFILSELNEGVSHVSSAKAYMLMPVLKQKEYLQKDIEEIEKLQGEVAGRRIERINGRINSLNKSKTDLKAKPGKKDVAEKQNKKVAKKK